MINKIPIIAIVGPTATGKTKLSIELAKHLNGEVISADSIQIYKDIDIASAKPSVEERKDIQHHLMDFLNVKSEFSVSRYVEMAKECADDINKRGKLSILCGGTGLYIDSFLNNTSFYKQHSNEQLRTKLLNEAKIYGNQYLLNKLSEFDAESASRLHYNDIKRIVRAIEIYYTTGITMTEQIKKSKCCNSPYSVCIIGLNYINREFLYKNINDRVDKMFNMGIVEEAKNILSMNPSKTAANTIGYKELIPYFKKEITLEESKEIIKRESRRYAKRQLTWFRRNKNINWIYIDECKSFLDVYNAALDFIKKSNLIIKDI